MGGGHGAGKEKEKTFEDESRAERVGTGWSEGRWCRAAAMSGSGPEREKSDMSRTLQLVTEYSELRGFRHGVPAVTVPGHVLGVRASTAVPNHPWRAEPAVWRSLLGTSATPQVNRVLRQATTCWPARYLGDGDVVSIATS
ncbi:hypothetical protein MTO96_030097 [Rhipicephalus appendiculatus]